MVVGCCSHRPVAVGCRRWRCVFVGFLLTAVRCSYRPRCVGQNLLRKNERHCLCHVVVRRKDCSTRVHYVVGLRCCCGRCDHVVQCCDRRVSTVWLQCRGE